MTARLLNRARKLLEGITPGPWKVWGMTVMWDRGGDSDVDKALEVATTYSPNTDRPRTFNADFIAAAPGLVAALCDALEAALAREAKLLHALEPMGDVMRVLAGEAPQQAELRKLHEQMEKLKREESKR